MFSTNTAYETPHYVITSHNNTILNESGQVAQKFPSYFPQVVAGATERNRRYSDDKVLKENIEKKQKRMMKNRESAARSRAKKQVSVYILIMHLHVFFQI